MTKKLDFDKPMPVTTHSAVVKISPFKTQAIFVDDQELIVDENGRVWKKVNSNLRIANLTPEPKRRYQAKYKSCTCYQWSNVEENCEYHADLFSETIRGSIIKETD